jgi:hypothetical protein
MVLLLSTATALLASLAGGFGAGRAVPAALAAVELVLLGRSLRWFPTYQL